MTQKLERVIGWGALVLLAGLPFHTFFSVWLGHLFGHMPLWQGWKEVLIAIITLASVLLLWRRNHWSRLNTRLNRVIAALVAFSLLVTAVFHGAGRTAVLIGAKTDLEFLVIFLAVQAAGSPRLRQSAAKILLVCAAAVSSFALAQAWLLPNDFLARFGYGPHTVTPYQSIGSHIRVLSTLGGPNQLGAFLILPLAYTLYLLLKRRTWWLGWGLLAVETGALYYSYSRSAWLGAAAAAVVITVLSAPRRIQTHALAAILVVLLGSLLVSSQQSVLLHGSPGSADTSDAKHLIAAQSGIRAMLDYPLGKGLGSAGPASFNSSSPLIPENYYLQVGVEIGIAGLLLYLTTQVLLAQKLLKISRRAELAGPLAATLIGIGIVNLFLHGWADSSTALTFWTLAGLTIGGGDNENA